MILAFYTAILIFVTGVESLYDTAKTNKMLEPTIELARTTEFVYKYRSKLDRRRISA